MELRPLIVLGALLALTVGNLYLLVTEEISPQEQAQEEKLENRDPLRNNTYTKGAREKNLTDFGMDKAMRAATLKRITLLEQQQALLTALIKDAPSQQSLSDALCGNTDQVRPRYGALEFLVTLQGERRRTIRLDQVGLLERQDWALSARIPAVYKAAELGSSRKADATVMALAAILEGEQQKLLDGIAPWGGGLVSGRWSWDAVTERYAGVDQEIVKYAALMHLTVEIAQGSSGICGGS